MKKTKKSQHQAFRLVKGSIDKKSLIILLGIGLIALIFIFFATSQPEGGNSLATTLAAKKKVIRNFSLKPQVVDTSKADVEITVQMQITSENWVCVAGDKDCSGYMGYSQMRLRSSNNQFLDFLLTRISGNGKNGKYKATAIMKKGSAGGAWKVESLMLIDPLNRATSFDYNALSKQGISRNALIINNRSKIFDDQSPVLKSISVSPTTIDSSDGEQTVTLTMQVADELSGICLAGDGDCIGGTATQTRFRSQTSNQFIDFYNFKRLGITSDNIVTITAEATLPENAASGLWQVEYVSLFDKAGNYKPYTRDQLMDLNISPKVIEFTNTSTTGDQKAPTVNSIYLYPQAMNTNSSSQVITLTIGLSDELTGVCLSDDSDCAYAGGTQLRLRRDGGNQILDFSALKLKTGTLNNGTFTATAEMPKGSEIGIWEVEYLMTVDKAMNRQSYSYDQLKQMPMETKVLEIVNGAPGL